MSIVYYLHFVCILYIHLVFKWKENIKQYQINVMFFRFDCHYGNNTMSFGAIPISLSLSCHLYNNFSLFLSGGGWTSARFGISFASKFGSYSGILGFRFWLLPWKKLPGLPKISEIHFAGKYGRVTCPRILDLETAHGPECFGYGTLYDRLEILSWVSTEAREGDDWRKVLEVYMKGGRPNLTRFTCQRVLEQKQG